MSKRAHPTLIGAFVVGAVLLIVAGIVVFSAGRFWGETLNYVLYFEDDLTGLTVGAPVTFRGTKVGTVSEIKVVIDAQGGSIRLPVIMTLDPETVEIVNIRPETIQEDLDEPRDRRFIRTLIEERGLRAQLQTQSLVTGQLLVQLDFFPDTPIRLRDQPVDGFPEFPTIPSKLNQLTKKLQDLPLEDLVGATLTAIQGLERILNSPDVRKLGAEARTLMTEFRRLVRDLNRELPHVARGADDTIRQTQDLVHTLQKSVDPLASRFQDVADAAQSSLHQAQKTLSVVEGLGSTNTRLGYRVDATLKELDAAARAVRNLAEYLARHPESMVRGKGTR